MREKIVESLQKSAQRGVLSMWTIYSHPADFPHSYVARRFEVGNGEPIATDDVVQGELSILREGFQYAGLVCLSRHMDDEPQIVETWI